MTEYTCGDPAFCGWPVDPCPTCPVLAARRALIESEQNQ